jgi:serine/threonine protein kinase
MLLNGTFTGCWDQLPQPDLGTGNPGNCRMKSLQPISAGGMGEVHKANDTRLDRIVAIKVSKTEFSKRFERESERWLRSIIRTSAS